MSEYLIVEYVSCFCVYMCGTNGWHSGERENTNSPEATKIIRDDIKVRESSAWERSGRSLHSKLKLLLQRPKAYFQSLTTNMKSDHLLFKILVLPGSG